MQMTPPKSPQITE